MNAKEVLPLTVDQMGHNEADQLSILFTQIVTELPYYNEAAKKSELAKYSSALLRDSISNDPDSVLIARAEREMVGFCLSEPDDDLIWLAWFGVHPSYRRRGIGAALLQKLENTVRNGRSHKIWCDCRTENEASKIILTNQGYEQLCTMRNHWYGQDYILWEKLVG